MFGGSVYLLDAHRDLTHSLEVDDVSGVMRIEERDVERFVDALRWFDVEEIKALHGVRSDFSFAASTSNKKSVFLLGNSISVDVVREILRFAVNAG